MCGNVFDEYIVENSECFEEGVKGSIASAGVSGAFVGADLAEKYKGKKYKKTGALIGGLVGGGIGAVAHSAIKSLGRKTKVNAVLDKCKNEHDLEQVIRYCTQEMKRYRLSSPSVQKREKEHYDLMVALIKAANKRRAYLINR